MTSISHTKHNNQHVCPHEPGTKQKEEDFVYGIKIQAAESKNCLTTVMETL